MGRDGSDWDYINEHMGGHDEDGLPNFLNGGLLDYSNESGFSGDENESTEELKRRFFKEKKRAIYILENLIARIEIEGLSLNHMTDIELASIKYALEEISSQETNTSDIEDEIPY